MAEDHAPTSESTRLSGADESSPAFQFQEWRHLFEWAPAGMMILSADHLKILHVNRALAALLGRDRRDLAGRRYGEIRRRDSQHQPVLGLDALQRGQTSAIRRKSCLIRRDGTPVWVWESISLLQPGRGKPARLIVHVADISDLHRRERHWRYLAHHDALTGLPNRRWFQRRLELLLHGVQRGGEGGAVLLVDLDHLKDINDSLGHSRGDQVLAGLAPALQAHVRPTDRVARIGGDEFAIILPGAGRVEAQRVMNRLQRMFSEYTANVDGRRVRVGASVGVAVFPEDGTTPMAIMAEADRAMYRDKGGGGGAYAHRSHRP